MLSSVQHFGLESKPAPAFAFLSWWVFKVCRIKFICLNKLNINYYNVLESEDECSEWEKLRRGGWKDGLFERTSNIASTDDLMWTNLVLVSSCVSCWSLVLFTGLIFPPHLCPIRLISPALHLHCTSFTGLSSSSSTSLLLVFFCSFPSPVSLHLHSSPSWGLFVCQLALLARSLSVRLFSSHPLVPPVILQPSCVPLFVLCFCCTVCLNSLHLSAFCDPSAYLLLDFASFWLHTNDTRTHTSFLSLHLAPVWM